MDYAKLASAMQKARLVLKFYREEKATAVQQFAGSHWSEEARDKKRPVNLLALYEQVVGRSLISQAPRVMLSTFKQELKPTVHAMEQWANQQIKKLRLADVFKRTVLDALFSVGIVKVALASPSDSASVAWRLPAGKPFCERVALDDFVFDVHARTFAEAGYIGHRSRVPIDVIKDSKIYNAAARKKLEPTPDSPYNLEGDEKASTLGKGFYSSEEEYDDFVDIWEIYLPHHRQVVTFAADDLSGVNGDVEPLREQRWLGPDCGPYHFLGYGWVPDNPMPKGPMQDLMDLDEVTNANYRKLGRQSVNSKTVGLIAGGVTEDGKHIQDASDGDLVRCDNPDRAKEMHFRGVDSQNMAFAIHTKDLFGYMAGNLDMMGGLSPQAKTLGQDKMLAENASKTVVDMQNTTIEHVSDCLGAMCWFWWNDPFHTMETTHEMPGTGLSIPRKVTPQQRQKGKWEDLDIEVDPYSLQHSTPQARVAALNGVVQSVIMPMAQLLQQQGVVFDVNAYLEKIAAYSDMPDLAEIVTMQEPIQGDPAGGEADAGPAVKPQETTRNYVRRSLGGDTPQNREATATNMQPGGMQGKNGQAGAA